MKVSPRSTLISAVRRLRIVHGGRDQVIEVDVLDVERLAEVTAAVAQELRHPGLVLGGIEFRLHVRLGGHLAENQRGGEDFDENGAHERGRTLGAPAGEMTS